MFLVGIIMIIIDIVFVNYLNIQLDVIAHLFSELRMFM